MMTDTRCAGTRPDDLMKEEGKQVLLSDPVFSGHQVIRSSGHHLLTVAH
jgi:hypothetical protein